MVIILRDLVYVQLGSIHFTPECEEEMQVKCLFQNATGTPVLIQDVESDTVPSEALMIYL